MPSPLDGITVLDMTIWQNGPFATTMLSDMGASVIKIEDPVNGDPGRAMSARSPKPRPINVYFETMNRNKRSMTLNLKSPEGRDIFMAMAKKADVVTQNFRLGVVEKLGVGYESVRKVNPRIIYGSVTGLGDLGPDARDPVFDIVGQARGGFTWLMSTPDEEVTYKVAGGLADQTGAIILAYGIMSALVARERFGVGQHVQTSQLGGQLTLQAMALNFYLMAGNLFTHGRRQEAGNPLWNLYRCSDGKWIALGCNQSDRYWADFCEVIGAPELLEDPRFKDHLTRYGNCKPLIETLDRLFANRPRDEWVRLLKARSIIAGPVQTHEDIPKDPQVIANNYVTEVPHPVHGKLRQVGVTVKLSETPAQARSAAPEFGQHTEEVLQEFGYSWEQIAGLRERGVL